MTKVLSIDPGPPTTGLVFYENWGKFKIYSFTAENWLEHAEFLENEVKTLKIDVLVVEKGKLFRKYSYGHQVDSLIKLGGACELLAKRCSLEYIGIHNTQRATYENRFAATGKVKGLELKEVKKVFEGKKRVSNRPFWFFQGQEINRHEKDAMVLLYIYYYKGKEGVTILIVSVKCN